MGVDAGYWMLDTGYWILDNKNDSVVLCDFASLLRKEIINKKVKIRNKKMAIRFENQHIGKINTKRQTPKNNQFVNSWLSNLETYKIP